MMKKTFFLNGPRLFFIVLILLFASCNSNNSAPAKTDTVDTAAKAVISMDNKQANLLPGDLDTLWIDSAKFSSLSRWLILRFYIDSSFISLRGWSANNDNGPYHPNPAPPPPPNVILLQGRTSTIKYSSGNYFGNILLRPADLLKIKGHLTPGHSKYVLFAPANPALNNSEITYDILVTDDDPRPNAPAPTVPVKPSIVATGVTANPSPPRNS